MTQTIQPARRIPEWIRVRVHQSENFEQLKRLVRERRLHTVCEEAHCPNIFDCWNRRTATFMILGDVCTRACRFCAVTSGRPTELDIGEPMRVAESVAELGLRHAVITSVDRDDLRDGGSEIFARTIRAIRRRSPGTSIEVLTPDFQGDRDAIRTVVEAGPDIFNHNTETVPRLYTRIRPRAVYADSLGLLAYVRELAPRMVTKSGVMVGLGEETGELLDVFRDMRRHRIDVLTVGQYLRPSARHAEVVRYYRPEEFAELRREALAMGFAHVESGWPRPADVRAIRAYWLGTIPYRDCWDLQRAAVAAIRAGGQPDSLLLLEHPAVFTIGRRGDGSTLLWSEAECARRGVEVVWSDRGGDATYHGPGQLVGYPLLDLPRLGSDILRHIRDLERSLIAYLRTLGIESEPGGPGLTGVWSGGGKVGAIGVKLNQHVTSHGFALNLTTDLDVFNTGIVPCGLAGRRATSVVELGGPVMAVVDAARAYVEHFTRTFEMAVEWGDAGELRRLPTPAPEPAQPMRVLNVP
jgi:lipoyl synthase